ncbi:MAG: hypothetical protein KME54_21515 [Tolypothrix brevis GSE-NOS-MK-07-07A]|jgi:hypothetical protein|nr:hypothetical protein [Tolypothrix brevis GSE-NOS-MK-07-07A]
MGLFTWLGSLLNQLITWLGKVVAAFLEALMWAIQAVWDTAIASVLIVAFGADIVLHAIFYAGAIAGETLMEVWDPRYHNSKPSEVFSVTQAPQDSPLPTQRSKAKVVALKNWA